eukprot:5407481-Pyramimonas_sp.AAC.1
MAPEDQFGGAGAGLASHAGPGGGWRRQAHVGVGQGTAEGCHPVVRPVISPLATPPRHFRGLPRQGIQRWQM